MMRSLRIGAFIVGLASLDAASARADGFITPFAGFNFAGDSANCVSLSNCNEKRLNWGVSLGVTRGIFGFEEDIGYAPSFFGTTASGDNAVLTAMSNLLVVVPAGPLQPYALVGIGLIRPRITLDLAGLTSKSNALGYDVGGGLNIFVAPHVGLRGDVRHLQTLEDVTLQLFSGEKLDFWRASAGLTLRF